jgi:signal transduction histidine kinase
MSSLARAALARAAGNPARVDALVAALLLVEIELQLWLSPHVPGRVPAALAGAVVCAGVAARRRFTFAAVSIVAAAMVGQAAVGGRLTQHAIGGLLALALLFYAAGVFLSERRAWLALLIGLVAVGSGVLIGGERSSDFFFGATLLALLPWALGRIVRDRAAREHAQRERAERLDATREQHATAAVYSERARIARELHDVIAHSVSVMVIQAGAARSVMDSEPERAETSLRSVERAGREALAEMRRLLGLLDGATNARELAPQPGLADIDGLIASTRAAGLATDLLIDGEPSAVAPALDLCAYRIVQEALTNAIKHAGPASAAVRVHWTAGALELEVSDNGRGPAAPNGSAGAGGGHGIAGMRERAALHGGSIEAGGADGRGFAVRVHLPLARRDR